MKDNLYVRNEDYPGIVIKGKASRSDVLEWLGGLTRREKLELLGWETCHECVRGWLSDLEQPCPNCLDGLVPPASQVEAMDGYGGFNRAALIAAMEGVSDE